MKDDCKVEELVKQIGMRCILEQLIEISRRENIGNRYFSLARMLQDVLFAYEDWKTEET